MSLSVRVSCVGRMIGMWFSHGALVACEFFYFCVKASVIFKRAMLFEMRCKY